MDIEELLKQLASDDDWIALKAIAQIKLHNDKRAIPHLLREARYETRQADYQRLAKKALEQGEINGAIAITEHLEGDAIDLRIECIHALGKVGDASVVPDLIEMMWNDEEPYVRYPAMEALEKIATPEALEAVKAWRARLT